MWSSLNGTIVNTATVLAGSLIGLAFAARIPERYRLIVLQSLGLVTLGLGIDAAVLEFANTVRKYAPLVANGDTYGARLAMVMIGSLLVGAILGTALRIEDRIESLGAWVHRRFATGDGHAFAKGFLTASILFCVGPLTLVGCLRNGANHDPSYLYVKATLDGFSSIALASTLGAGVLGSLIAVIVIQGSISLAAASLTTFLEGLPLSIMTIVGGFVLLATALSLLDIKKIAVANMLPGIVLAPISVHLLEMIQPGLLLPHAVGGS